MSLNITSLKTPGVYVDEVSLFPPSVAQVDTAVPVFIGPTRIAHAIGQPVRIASMAEYRSLYGGAPDHEVKVQIVGQTFKVTQVAAAAYLHDSLLLYFANGGEKCYVVSTGIYSASAPSAHEYGVALTELAKFDEPTLVVIPDAMHLSSTDRVTIQSNVLAHCGRMQDRFAILDVYMDPNQAAQSTSSIRASLEAFRQDIGTSDLSYGAAYYPYLQTTLSPSTAYSHLQMADNSYSSFSEALEEVLSSDAGNPAALATIAQLDNLEAAIAAVQALLPTQQQFYIHPPKEFLQEKMADLRGLTFSSSDIMNSLSAYLANSVPSEGSVADLDAHLNAITSNNASDSQGLYAQVYAYIAGFVNVLENTATRLEANLSKQAVQYASIMQQVAAQGVVLPPSGAVAGAVARTDGNRGVWKSPANVSLSYVAGPVVTITDDVQDGMNVDTNTGKSINAIRAFTGKGTLVWGARTLAGNDNEWRYVSVRRFFLMAEESIKKATAQFVFEANDANTWVRIRAMVENFLTLQWRAGALAGAKTDQAFFVRVGLGQTMTPQDVLEGRMIVEIGLAVVRPAEFIVLRFSHKMQEA